MESEYLTKLKKKKEELETAYEATAGALKDHLNDPSAFACSLRNFRKIDMFYGLLREYTQNIHFVECMLEQEELKAINEETTQKKGATMNKKMLKRLMVRVDKENSTYIIKDKNLEINNSNELDRELDECEQLIDNILTSTVKKIELEVIIKMK